MTYVTNRQALTALRSSQGTLEKYCLRVDGPAIQAHKLARSQKKMKRQINRLIQKKFAAETCHEERLEIESKLVKLEERYHWKVIRMQFLQEAIKVLEKRKETRQENEMERARIVRERINRTKCHKPRDTSLPSEQAFHAEKRDTEKIANRYKKQAIVKTKKGGRKVKQSGFHKTFDNV